MVDEDQNFEKEFLSYWRLSGTEDVSDIKSPYLEINGQVSFIKKWKTGANSNS